MSALRLLLNRQWRVRQAAHQCYTSSSISCANISPYRVLGVQSTATIDQIKSAFRKLAKQHHPDLNSAETSMDKMSEIIAAYEALTESDFGGGRNSSVALACEVLTLDELRRDRKHDIYSIRIRYPLEFVQEEVLERECNQDLTNQNLPIDSNYLDIETHPDDSVTDFKKCLERLYGCEWGLENRQKDRYGLATGWEVVVTNNTRGELEILGNHWFLRDYQVFHRDIIYAIVRKYGS